MNRVWCSLLLGMLCLTGLPSLAQPVVNHDVESIERLLLRGLAQLNAGQMDDAIKSLAQVVSVQPDFRLAQLVYGDLLMAKAHGIRRFGLDSTEHAEQISGLLDEARKRWYVSQRKDRTHDLPRALLQLSPLQHRAIAIDLSESRLYLFENRNGTPVLVEDYYISIGKNGAGKRYEGDKRTPIGVYFISRRLDADDLPDLYGAGALPINYPNAWDRHRGKTGGGIWLHGTPSDTYSRVPWSSDGCVALPNVHFKALDQIVEADQKTPVVIAEHLEWLATSEVLRLRNEFWGQLTRWKADWESLDVDRYLQHYAADFSSPIGGFGRWATKKHQVVTGKRFIDVKLENVSLLRQPGNEALVVVTFDQVYRSNTLNGRMSKRQYWRQENGRWQIIFEGDISSVPLTKVARASQ